MTAALAEALVQLLAPVLVALAAAAGGWLLTHVSGPLRDFLAANVHARDVELVLGAMARRALVHAPAGPPTVETTADVVAYARETLPEVVGKLAPSRTALETMAAAAIVRAMAEKATAASAAVQAPATARP